MSDEELALGWVLRVGPELSSREVKWRRLSTKAMRRRAADSEAERKRVSDSQRLP
jgi:hypothetical protein